MLGESTWAILSDRDDQMEAAKTEAQHPLSRRGSVGDRDHIEDSAAGELQRESGYFATNTPGVAAGDVNPTDSPGERGQPRRGRGRRPDS